MPSLRIKRGTRAQIDAAALAGQLANGELYRATDSNLLAAGVSSTAWLAFRGYVYVGPWSGLQSAGLSAGDVAFITDIGTAGVELYWTGSAWRVARPTQLYSRYGTQSNPVSTLTGITASKFALPGVNNAVFGVPIPAALLLNGPSLEVEALISRTTAVATAHFMGDAATADSANVLTPHTAFTNVAAQVGRTARFATLVTFDGTNMYRTNWLQPVSTQVGAATNIAFGLNSSGTAYIGVGVTAANAGDTFVLVGLRVVLR